MWDVKVYHKNNEIKTYRGVSKRRMNEIMDVLNKNGIFGKAKKYDENENIVEERSVNGLTREKLELEEVRHVLAKEIEC